VYVLLLLSETPDTVGVPEPDIPMMSTRASPADVAEATLNIAEVPDVAVPLENVTGVAI
jgi:hypothetical protein